MLHARCGMLGTGGPGRGSESAEGAGLGSQRDRARSGPPCPTIDGSPPGSPVPGILQARTLEWVAISFSNA